MARGLSTGEGLLTGLAGAIPGAIQGYQDMKANEMKQKEVEAQIEARKENQKWKELASKMAAEKNNFDIVEGPGGDIDIKKREGFMSEQQKYADTLLTKGFSRNPETGALELAPWKQRELELEKLKDGDPRLEAATDLRKEFTKLKEVKDAKDVETAFRKVRSSAKAKSAAGDLALVFNYMKLLDPGSVVRESEFRSAEAAKSWLSRADDQGIYVPSPVRTAIQKTDPDQKGAFLLPEQRTDFLNRAKDLYKDQYAQYKSQSDYYKDLAKKYNTDPELITGSGLINPQDLMNDRQQLDPQIQGYADEHGLSYEQAQALIEKRKQKMNADRRPQSDGGLLGL